MLLTPPRMTLGPTFLLGSSNQIRFALAIAVVEMSEGRTLAAKRPLLETVVSHTSRSRSINICKAAALIFMSWSLVQNFLFLLMTTFPFSSSSLFSRSRLRSALSLEVSLLGIGEAEFLTDSRPLSESLTTFEASSCGPLA